LYNNSINCWGRIDPEAQKQETKHLKVKTLNFTHFIFSKY